MDVGRDGGLPERAAQAAVRTRRRGRRPPSCASMRLEQPQCLAVTNSTLTLPYGAHLDGRHHPTEQSHNSSGIPIGIAEPQDGGQSPGLPPAERAICSTFSHSPPEPTPRSLSIRERTVRCWSLSCHRPSTCLDLHGKPNHSGGGARSTTGFRSVWVEPSLLPGRAALASKSLDLHPGLWGGWRLRAWSTTLLLMVDPAVNRSCGECRRPCE